MKWLKSGLIAAAALLCVAAQAQQLYKYVDKDGNVTYSDRAPKGSEKADPVEYDKKANVVPGKPAPPKTGVKTGVGAKLEDRRSQVRDKLRAEVEAAEKALASAKQNLEDGREPKQSEVQVVVRKDGNSIIRKPEYDERIAVLEENVKKAEQKLADAEAKYRRGAPD